VIFGCALFASVLTQCSKLRYGAEIMISERQPVAIVSLGVVLDKIAIMREELLTIERLLERMQKGAVELTERREHPRLAG